MSKATSEACSTQDETSSENLTYHLCNPLCDVSRHSLTTELIHGLGQNLTYYPTMACLCGSLSIE